MAKIAEVLVHTEYIIKFDETAEKRIRDAMETLSDLYGVFLQTHDREECTNILNAHDTLKRILDKKGEA